MVPEQKARIAVPLPSVLVMHVPTASVPLARAVPILSVLATLAPRVSVPLAVSVLILNAPVTRAQRESVPATPDLRVSVLLVRPTRAATVLAQRIDPRVLTLLRSSMTHSVQSR
jgi:hypothetical protein